MANRTRLPPPLPSCQNYASFTAQHKEVHLCTRHTHTLRQQQNSEIFHLAGFMYEAMTWSTVLLRFFVLFVVFFKPGYPSRFPATKKTVYHPSSVPHHRHLSLVKKTSESSSVALCGASECSYIHLTHTHTRVCTYTLTNTLDTHSCLTKQADLTSHMALRSFGPCDI